MSYGMLDTKSRTRSDARRPSGLVCFLYWRGDGDRDLYSGDRDLHTQLHTEKVCRP